MKVILSGGESLTAVLGGAATTTNPYALASWGGGSSSVQLSGATAVTLAAAPGNAVISVDEFSVHNADTAAATVTLKRVVGSTSYTLAVVTLQAGDTLVNDAAGLRVMDTSGNLKQTSVATAVQPFTIPAHEWRKTDGVTLNAATAATTNFGVVYGTDGTNFPTLQTIDGKNATTAVVSRCVIRLPPNYVAGSAITLRFNAGMLTTVASNTGATTLGVNVYARGAGNLGGTDLCTTAAQSVNSLTFANKDYTVTPTGLVAGDDLHVKITLTVTDVATGTAVIGAINHAELRCSVSQ